MPYRTALAALILTIPLALGASGKFKTGDRIFIRAQILGCGEDIRTVDTTETVRYRFEGDCIKRRLFPGSLTWANAEAKSKNGRS